MACANSPRWRAARKKWSRCCFPSPAACSPPSRDKRLIIPNGCVALPARQQMAHPGWLIRQAGLTGLSNGRLQCVTELRGLIGGQLDNEPAATLQRDAHHDAAALL